MRKQWRVLGAMALVLSMSTVIFADVPAYYNQTEYEDVLRDNYYEDRGIVIENNPELGYIKYRNSKGKTVTRNYYPEEISVEKQPYYETEDKIGYLDEIFPNFSYDPRDTSVSNIKSGDNIYIKMNMDKEVVYISAYNDYIMRYGKVISFEFNTGATSNLLLEDEKGNIYSYQVITNTPVSKGSVSCSISEIKPGSWAKVLVAQKILGEGIVEEALEEIVLDNDSRTISSLYRGQVTSIDTYKNVFNFKNAQKLGKLTWGDYNNLLSLSMNMNTVKAYLSGNQISIDYINRNLKNASGYVYVAAEDYKGKENAVKLNFQSKLQSTLTPSTVTYASGNTVKLLSGETIYVAEDAIVVRDKRLVGASNIMVGDTLQAVVSGENKLAVGNITSEITTGALQVFRGRIKQITDREEFQVETFSLLEESTWYYHPTPRTFTIDRETKLISEAGVQSEGIDKFIAYGEDSEVGNVYSIIAEGDHATAIIKMPYVKESVQGQIYEAQDGSIKLKDVYYYNTSRNKWLEYSSKNYGATIEIGENTVIIKDGKMIPVSKLEKDDIVSVMVEKNLKDANGTTKGYIITVKN